MWRGDPHYRTLVIVPKMAEICKECGCSCNSCFSGNSLDLHHQIEELRSKLLQNNSHIGQLETDFESRRLDYDFEIGKLQDELVKLRDRYDRLYESHKKLSRVNQGLEEKLLSAVSRFENEKTNLQKEIAGLTSRMVDARMTICDLEDECERFRNDCNTAVQLLQCKPSNFIAHKLNTLPLDLQQRLKPHMAQEEIIELEKPPLEQKTIRVPMPTFPPTAMVYSVNKLNTVQIETRKDESSVPVTLIAKVLTHQEPKKRPKRTYICDKCKKDFTFVDKQIQTTAMTEQLRSREDSFDSSSSFSYIHKASSRGRLNSTETEI
ncbi:brain-enriched guanylate kinase-associated protein-like [Tubulanus polymorphus]|uniref:brain-enriched guanylate kinase-associated protein-like n=1 Tax=Tubulanus polymorphus TaxID=672921 RepID=UPI003DA4969B